MGGCFAKLKNIKITMDDDDRLAPVRINKP